MGKDLKGKELNAPGIYSLTDEEYVDAPVDAGIYHVTAKYEGNNILYGSSNVLGVVMIKPSNAIIKVKLGDVTSFCDDVVKALSINEVTLEEFNNVMGFAGYYSANVSLPVIYTGLAERDVAMIISLDNIYHDGLEDGENEHAVILEVSDMAKEGETAVGWLKGQNLAECNVIHLQGVMGSAAQIGRSGALDKEVAANANWNLVVQQTANWSAEEAQQIVQSVIDAGTPFNVIYAENDDMAKGAVAALDKANISHGVGKDVIVMGFDCNKWALEELLKGNWNYDGQCNPFQASYINEIIQKLENGETLSQKTIIMDEKGFDASTITQADVDNYGI